MSFKRRVLAGILALLVFCALTFSVSFIILEVDHDCAGDDCPVCAIITACVNAVKASGLCILSVAPVSVLFFALCFKLNREAVLREASTLTTLKIRLLN